MTTYVDNYCSIPNIARPPVSSTIIHTHPMNKNELIAMIAFLAVFALLAVGMGCFIYKDWKKTSEEFNKRSEKAHEWFNRNHTNNTISSENWNDFKCDSIESDVNSLPSNH